jgi:hypothetical protein
VRSGFGGRPLTHEFALRRKGKYIMPDDPNMAAIKGREAAVRDAIRRGEPMVEAGPFNVAQLGLYPVYGDRQGRLWRNEGGVLVLVK